MSNRLFAVNADTILLSGPVGDLATARRAAARVLRDGDGDSDREDVVLHRLVLTGALLHCAAGDLEVVRRSDVLALLERLDTMEDPATGFVLQRAQFLRYVADEVSLLAPSMRRRLFRNLRAAVATR